MHWEKVESISLCTLSKSPECRWDYVYRTYSSIYSKQENGSQGNCGPVLKNISQ